MIIFVVLNRPKSKIFYESVGTSWGMIFLSKQSYPTFYVLITDYLTFNLMNILINKHIFGKHLTDKVSIKQEY